jgi:hypothetical protein
MWIKRLAARLGFDKMPETLCDVLRGSKKPLSSNDPHRRVISRKIDGDVEVRPVWKKIGSIFPTFHPSATEPKVESVIGGTTLFLENDTVPANERVEGWISGAEMSEIFVQSIEARLLEDDVHFGNFGYVDEEVALEGRVAFHCLGKP